MKRFLIAFFLLISTFIHAQEPTVYIKTLTTNDGLSSNTIRNIYKDSLGFMWFATPKGLDRYDGYHFKHIPVENKNGRSELKIFTITEWKERPGYLLLGTNDGLYEYRPGQNRIRPFGWKALDTISVRAKWIQSIYYEKQGRCWIGLSDFLLHVDLKERNIKKYSLIEGLHLRSKYHRIYTLAMDHKQNLWLGTKIGLIRFNTKTGNFFLVYKNRQKSLSSIKRIQIDQNGNAWFAHYANGIGRYDPIKKQTDIFRIPKKDKNRNFCNNLIIDGRGSIWAFFLESGLFKFEKESKRLLHVNSNSMAGKELLKDKVNALYLDRQAQLWLGSESKGLGKFNSNASLFYNYNFDKSWSLKSRLHPYSFYKDEEGYIWLGVIGRNGVLRLDPVENVLLQYNPQAFPKCKTTKILKKDKNHFWVFTIGEGLLVFNRLSGAFTSESIKKDTNTLVNDIFTAVQDKKGDLWIAPLKGGLVHYRVKTKQSRYYPIIRKIKGKGKHEHISFLYKSISGVVYAGTIQGRVLKYDDSTDRFWPLLQVENKINALLVTKDGNIYLATRKGLIKYNEVSKEMITYNTSSGFAENSILGILPDDHGNLWLSHKAGLTKFNTETNQCKNYNYLNGISNSNFVLFGFYKAADGHLFFGNETGMTVLYSSKEYRTPLPDIQISELKVVAPGEKNKIQTLFYKKVTAGHQIVLPYNSYVFMFDFFLTNFNRPNINQFKYKLDGLNENWQDLGSRHLITFLNLPSGSYTLRLKGKTYDGNWIEKKQPIRFTIQTPFWQTWWFWTLVILAFISIGYLIFKLRVRAIRKRNRDLEIINKQLNEQIAVRQQVEELLRTSEAKYRTLVESIDEGILTIDQKGTLYFLNKRAAAYLNGLPEELSGRNVKELLPPELIVPFIQTVVTVLETETGQEINAEINRNGKQEYFHLSFQPLKKDGEAKPLVLCVMAETTARVELEEKLRQAQKMEAIGNLAGGVAHDFNNLLSVIRGYSFLLLKDTNASKDILESIREIDEASERAQTLTRQLLAFSRKQLMKPKILDINQLINNLHKLLSRLIGENIQLELNLEAKIKPVLADPGQMEQVLMNLVVNAKDAMPKGGQLLIRTENISSEKELKKVRDPHAGSYIGIHVSDTGAGIDKELLTKIFDPFFTTKETGKGTGLGLSTVFGIVKQSDGYIVVDSKPGKGSTFSIYLPQSEKTTKKKEFPQEQVVTANGNKTILVIEDESGVRSMISKMLKLYGYKSYLANSGAQGITIYNSHKQEIDLILSDVVMPGMSGMEMVQILQKTAPDIPAIFMSGYTDDEIIRHGVKEDGIHFLQKPFDPDTLIRTIQKILGN